MLYLAKCTSATGSPTAALHITQPCSATQYQSQASIREEGDGKSLTVIFKPLITKYYIFFYSHQIIILQPTREILYIVSMESDTVGPISIYCKNGVSVGSISEYMSEQREWSMNSWVNRIPTRVLFFWSYQLLSHWVCHGKSRQSGQPGRETQDLNDGRFIRIF